MDKTLIDWFQDMSKWTVFGRLVTSTLPNSATTSVTTYAVRFYIWRWNQVPTGLYHTFETRLEVCRGHRTGDLGKQIWVRLKARPNSQCVCFHYFCSESLLRIHWADRVVYIRPNHFVKHGTCFLAIRALLSFLVWLGTSRIWICLKKSEPHIVNDIHRQSISKWPFWEMKSSVFWELHACQVT